MGYICRNALNLVIFVVTAIFATKNLYWSNPEYIPVVMLLSTICLMCGILFSEMECHVKHKLRSSGYKRSESESNRDKEVWILAGEQAYILNNKVLRAMKLTTSWLMLIILIVSYGIL